jgi:peptidylprolyl isomerase
VAADDLVSIQAVIVNGRDGKVVNSTGRPAPSASTSARGPLRVVQEPAAGQEGRLAVLITSTAADAFGDTGNDDLGVEKDDPIVFVVDVVSASKPLTEAQGKAVAPKAGLPTVTMNEGSRRPSPSPRAPRRRPRRSSSRSVEGTGPEVKKGQTVRVAYTGRAPEGRQRLRPSATTPSSRTSPSRSRRPGHQGLGQRPAGPEGRQPRAPRHPAGRGLRRRGSPPKIAGTDTLVFVVDILAAY